MTSVAALVVLVSLIAAGDDFDAFLARVTTLEEGARQQVADAYVHGLGTAPIVEEAGVVFLARREAAGRTPHIVSDANNWARDTEDGSWIGDPMRPIAGTDLLYQRLSLEPAARLSYRIAYSIEDQTLDPLNPTSILSFGTERSVVTMPGYEPRPETLDLASVEAHGRLERIEFESKVMDVTRTVHVYTPSQAEDSKDLPVVFFHDGSAYVRNAKVPQILDRLLEAGRIQPLIAVFVDPLDRRSEYRMHEGYRRFFKEELIPWVDSSYPTRSVAGARAIYGGSRGALAAADLVLREPRSIGHCVCFSPATRPTDLLATIEQAPPDAPSFFILISRYDLRFRRDGVALADLLKGRGYKVEAIEVSDGHSLRAWQNYLGQGLASASALAPPQRTTRSTSTTGH